MKAVISGASGLMGRALVRALRAKGHEVARLTRPGGSLSPGDIRWDPTTASVDMLPLEGADVLVHLSGASIAHRRWTHARKAVLRASRVDSTRVLVDALARLRNKPRAFLCASATGYYGDRGDEVLTEASEGGTDFLALLARDWEAEARRASSAGIRTVLLRFGVIFSAEGGALPTMLLPFRLCAGGRFGAGTQWMSWVTLEDATQILLAVLENESVSGPINIVSPNPVQNAEFTRIVARTLHRPAVFPAPVFALRAALGEMADVLLLASQRVKPERLLALGYSFRFAEIEAALQAVLHPSKKS